MREHTEHPEHPELGQPIADLPRVDVEAADADAVRGGLLSQTSLTLGGPDTSQALLPAVQIAREVSK
jgi:hypothetical protein